MHRRLILLRDNAATGTVEWAATPPATTTAAPAAVGRKRPAAAMAGGRDAPLPRDDMGGAAAHTTMSAVGRGGGGRKRRRMDATVHTVASPKEMEADAMAHILAAYFQLHVDLTALTTCWSTADARMAVIATALPGLRILQQDPWECLLSFICSSNNNIPRIMQMLDALRTGWGNHVAHYGGREWHAFPTPSQLAAATEDDLRGLGFGYRAKYITAVVTAVMAAGGEGYLLGLRGMPRERIQEELMKFAGVGRKVADCVALFSLGVRDAIPVDTHVWNIACRHFNPALRAAKSLTPRVYDAVGDEFRRRFGEAAGWAHSWLFAAELVQFRPLLPPTMVAEMAAVRAEERAAAKLAAAARAANKRGGDATAAGGAERADGSDAETVDEGTG